MKILILHTFYRYPGGEESIVANEIALLKTDGHEVELFGFYNSSHSISEIVSLLFAPFNLFSMAGVVKKIRSFQPDVVHLHNWHFAASPAVIVACHRQKVPIVLSIHNFRLLCPSGTLFHDGKLYHDSLKRSFPWRAVFDGVYRNSKLLTFWLAFTLFLHRKLKTWQKVNQFIVNSDFVKSLFLQSSLHIDPVKITVKANSIRDFTFDVEIKREKYFLFIGRMVEEKGVNVLLDAFAHNGLPLLIYGYGPLETNVRTYAERYSNITFQGILPNERVAEELRKCAALIFPSTWYEGMPITLLEAFSTGTPVIASKIGAMSTMVQDQYNGLHFEPGNIEDLNQKLRDWQGLSEMEKMKFSKQARQSYLDHYTQEINLNALDSIYKRAINS
jgi:glycosyltransferase involved in cell wall biosynthesis